MASMSVLSLNFDCLAKILSYVDDFRVFYSFSLTCKHFYEFSKHSCYWHESVKTRKLEFYALKFLIYEYVPIISRYYYQRDWQGYQTILTLAKVYQMSIPTYSNVVKVWEILGPVAAELFTWVDVSFGTEGLESVHNIIAEPLVYKRWCIRSPVANHNRIMIGVTQRYGRRWDFNVEVLNDDDIIIYKAIIESMTLNCYLDINDKEREKVKSFLEPIAALFQEMLGETVPSVTSHFLYCLFCYPVSLQWNDMEEKVLFETPSKNARPTPESQSIYIACKRIEESRSGIKTIGQSNNIGIIEDLLTNCKVSWKERSLRILEEETQFILRQYDRNDLNTGLGKVLMLLTLRVTIDTYDYFEIYPISVTAIIIEIRMQKEKKIIIDATPDDSRLTLWRLLFIFPDRNYSISAKKLRAFRRSIEQKAVGGSPEEDAACEMIEPVTRAIKDFLRNDLSEDTINEIVTNVFVLEYIHKIISHYSKKREPRYSLI